MTRGSPRASVCVYVGISTSSPAACPTPGHPASGHLRAGPHLGGGHVGLAERNGQLQVFLLLPPQPRQPLLLCLLALPLRPCQLLLLIAKLQRKNGGWVTQSLKWRLPASWLGQRGCGGLPWGHCGCGETPGWDVLEGVPGVLGVGCENQEKPEAASWLGIQRGRACPSPDPQSGRRLHALRHVGLSLTLTSTSTSERNQMPHPCWEMKQAEARHQIRNTERLLGTPPSPPAWRRLHQGRGETEKLYWASCRAVGGWHGCLKVAGKQSQLNRKEMGRRTRRAWASMTGHDAWVRGAGAGDFTLK